MRQKGVTFAEVLVASLILVIVIVGAMLMLQHNNRLAIEVEKNFIAESLIRKYFEKCANQGSRNGILYILGPYTTKTTGTISFSDSSGFVNLTLGAPLDSSYSGGYGIMHDIDLEFELSTINVPTTQAGTSSLLKAKAIASYDGGKLEISTILGR